MYRMNQGYIFHIRIYETWHVYVHNQDSSLGCRY